MQSKNVIEVNGKRYDAVSGNLLSADASESISVKVKTNPIARPVSASLRQKNVDGIIRVKKAIPASQLHKKVVQPVAVRTVAATPKPVPKVAETVVPVAPKPSHHIPVKRAANHAVHHPPQTTHTLMRTAVTKPGPGFKKQINVQSALQHGTPSVIVKKTSVNSITPERLLRAKATAQSHHISRFDHAVQGVPVTVTDLPVQPAPNKAAPAVPNAPAPASTSAKPLDMFEQALANATNFVDTKAHTAKYKKKARKHALSMAAGVLALFVIAGFAIFQNTPGLQIKVASLQAGVSTAHTPDFAAAGFAYKGVSGQSGKLTLGFSNGSNTYQLTQQPTNWTSNGMINNISSVSANGRPNYQTLQAGDTAIYRFSNNSATWVKDGTWYQVSGRATLTDDQIKALAANS